MLTLRFPGETQVTSSPSSRTRPASGSSKPAIMRSVVVLPQPLGPSIEKNSPAGDVEGDVVDRHDVAEALGRRARARSSVSLRSSFLPSDRDREQIVDVGAGGAGDEQLAERCSASARPVLEERRRAGRRRRPSRARRWCRRRSRRRLGAAVGAVGVDEDRGDRRALELAARRRSPPPGWGRPRRSAAPWTEGHGGLAAAADACTGGANGAAVGGAVRASDGQQRADLAASPSRLGRDARPGCSRRGRPRAIASQAVVPLTSITVWIASASSSGDSAAALRRCARIGSGTASHRPWPSSTAIASATVELSGTVGSVIASSGRRRRRTR